MRILRDITRDKELEREVVEIASLEQRRIGQDLHDSVGQELAALNLLAGDLAESLRTNSTSSSKLVDRLLQGLQRSQRSTTTQLSARRWPRGLAGSPTWKSAARPPT